MNLPKKTKLHEESLSFLTVLIIIDYNVQQLDKLHAPASTFFSLPRSVEVMGYTKFSAKQLSTFICEMLRHCRIALII